MPRVPQYDNLQVSAGGASNARFDAPEAPDIANRQLAQSGQSLMSAGSVAGKIALDIQEQANKVRTVDASDQLERFRIRSTYDKDAGFMFKKGAAALDTGDKPLPQIYGEAFDEEANRLESSLGNDAQKQAFRAVANQKRQGFNADISRHLAQEFSSRQKEVFADTLKTETNGASLEWAIPGRLEAHTQIANAALGEWAKAEGITDPAQLEALKLKSMTPFHSNVAMAMLEAKKPEAAKAYLIQNAKELTPEARAGISKAIENTSQVETAIRFADGYADVFSTEKEQLEAARKDHADEVIDGETRKLIESRIEHRWAKTRAAKDDRTREVLGAAQDFILTNKIGTVTDLPPSLYNALKAQGQLASMEAFASREGRPAMRQDELKQRGELLVQATDNPAEFIAEFRRTGFVDRIDIGMSGIQEMQNIATGMIQNNGKYKTAFDPKTLQDAIPADLLKASKKDQKDAFVAIMHETGAKWIKEHPGQVPDEAATLQVIRAANKEWVNFGRVWNSTATAYEVRAKPSEKAVPKDFYDALEARGATKAEILAAWQIKNGGK